MARDLCQPPFVTRKYKGLAMKIIGMDLGTSNTYLYGMENIADDALSLLPEPIILKDISDDSGSIATVVMYEDGHAALAGNIAESEFYANIAEQPRRFLASQFKPEIAQAAPGAMCAMTDFLAILKTALGGRLESDSEIYVGMPSLAREDFSINLRKCFLEAGWPKPRFVRESDAALVSCLQSGVIDADDISHKCLILDFGGGTCDYTSVENMDALQNGGDTLYGGRLFDDLFYQVFCRQNSDFAAEMPASPYAWYVHWIECKNQKEKFSNALNSLASESGDEQTGPVLHAAWFTARGERREAWIKNYSRDDFIIDAENYLATPEMLKILESYQRRGAIGKMGEDLIAGKRVALLGWLKDILSTVSQPGAVSRVIITGGSSRWFFVRDIIAKIFTHATCVPSNRGFEDIAFGLALYPSLTLSRKRVQKLLDEKIGAFTGEAIDIARKIIQRETDRIIRICGERIVERDVLPTLEEARKKPMTVGEMENAFSENIKNDALLIEAAKTCSENLSQSIQQELNFAFRNWLKENGVLLVPNFTFPTQIIGKEFFEDVNVKISRLDSLNLMNFTLTKVLPLLGGTATAGVIAHSGEPVSSVLGGTLAFGALWLTAKAAPKFMASRKMPSFLLTDANRKKIAEKNREYIEECFRKSMAGIESKILASIETRLGAVLHAMLDRLSALNQVKAS